MSGDPKKNPLLAKFEEARRKANKTSSASSSSSGRSQSTAIRKPTTKLPKKDEPPKVAGKVIIGIGDQRIGRMLANHFKTVHLEPVVVDNAMELVMLVHTEQPKLIILDAELKDAPGSTTCSRIRAVPEAADVPIIISNPEMSNTVREQAEMIGANGVVRKPFQIPELMQEIRSVLQKKKPE